MQRKRHAILLVDDEELFREQFAALLRTEGYTDIRAVGDGIDAINALQASSYSLVLLDYYMPKVNGIEVLQFIKEKYPATEVIMITGTGDVKVAVEAMKLGAYHYITKPVMADELMQIVSRALEHHDLIVTNSVLKSDLTRIIGTMELVGRSPALMHIMELARRVAPTDTSVLVQGASGTGKELIANYIYKNSARESGPFVTINCASIPDTLIESELFGYEKGAFTDARTQKQGLAELANTGTLFLDEVGDISAVIQPKLLRFIQTGEFRRVGGNDVHRADVRILCATNKDLRMEVKEGRFREDLLYRLNVVTLVIPPLCERKEDIPLLVDNFLNWKFRRGVQKRVSPEAMALLMEHDWPGNVRELENVVESSVILSQGEVIQPEDLLLAPVQRKNDAALPASVPSSDPMLSLKETERIHIAAVLANTAWDKKSAAKILGISLKTLYTKIAQYHLTPA